MSKINFEEAPFLPGLEESNSGGDQETVVAELTQADKTSKKVPTDDDLSFNCEVCGDTEGGCPQCGFGRK